MLSSVLNIISTYQNKRYDFASDVETRKWLEKEWTITSEADLYKLAKEYENVEGNRSASIVASASNLRDMMSLKGSELSKPHARSRSSTINGKQPEIVTRRRAGSAASTRPDMASILGQSASAPTSPLRPTSKLLPFTGDSTLSVHSSQKDSLFAATNSEQVSSKNSKDSLDKSVNNKKKDWKKYLKF